MENADLSQQAPKARHFSTPLRNTLLLLLVNLAGIAVIALLPQNTSFLKYKIQGFYATKARLGGNTDSTARYNLVYDKETAIIHLLDSALKEGDIFLLPPQYYLVEKAYRTRPATDPYTWTYPSKFKNLAMNKVNFVEITYPDSLLQKTTHTFLADKKGLHLISFADYSSVQKEAIINKLKTYQPFGFFIPQTAVDYLKQKNKSQWKP